MQHPSGSTRLSSQKMEPDRPSDAELVERTRAGRAEAFGELVRRHQRAAWAVAWALSGDATEAQDLAQEAFVRAFANLHLLASAARFGPWLRRIVVGVTIDWLRAFRPELYRANTSAALDVPSAAKSSLERLEEVELALRVAQAIAALPERYQRPLVLFHLDGLEQDKIARFLGVPAGTVRSLISRARRRLAAALADHDPQGQQMTDQVLEEPPPARPMLHL